MLMTRSDVDSVHPCVASQSFYACGLLMPPVKAAMCASAHVISSHGVYLGLAGIN